MIVYLLTDKENIFIKLKFRKHKQRHLARRV